MKIYRPFNVCSLAYFLWYGSLYFMVLCRTSPRRIIQLLFIPVSTSGEYLYKSFMLRESRRGILLQRFKTRSDWERLETLYHCPSLRSNVSRIREIKVLDDNGNKTTLSFDLIQPVFTRCFQQLETFKLPYHFDCLLSHLCERMFSYS